MGGSVATSFHKNGCLNNNDLEASKVMIAESFLNIYFILNRNKVKQNFVILLNLRSTSEYWTIL